MHTDKINPMPIGGEEEETKNLLPVPFKPEVTYFPKTDLINWQDIKNLSIKSIDASVRVFVWTVPRAIVVGGGGIIIYQSVSAIAAGVAMATSEIIVLVSSVAKITIIGVILFVAIFMVLVFVFNATSKPRNRFRSYDDYGDIKTNRRNLDRPNINVNVKVEVK